jgi:hypothetical protein
MTPTTADWEALEEAIAGRVILPGLPGYETARKPAMARFDVWPAAIALCTTPADVAEVFAFARAVPGWRRPRAVEASRVPAIRRPKDRDDVTSVSRAGTRARRRDTI